MTRCIILSAAPNVNIDYCKKEIKPTDYIICADGGYTLAQRLNITPNLIVGDFDSYTQKLPADSTIIKLPCEKDDTDTMYCVKEALKRGFLNIVILGGIGGRLDHTIANLCVLQYLSNNGAKGTLKDANNVVSFCPQGNFHLFDQCGKTVSVFPFGCEKCNVTHNGFKYQLNKQDVLNSFPLGVSNVVTENEATITIHSGGAIVIINN